MLPTGLALTTSANSHLFVDPSQIKADHLAKVSGQYLERPGLHGVIQTNVAHRLGPDPFRQIPSLVGVKFDQGRPPREGFGSISRFSKDLGALGFPNYIFLFFVYGLALHSTFLFKFQHF